MAKSRVHSFSCKFRPRNKICCFNTSVRELSRLCIPKCIKSYLSIPYMYVPELSFDGQRTARIKIGHGGVLDKHAHGVMAIGLEGGCKILPRLLHGKKVHNHTTHSNHYIGLNKLLV